MAEASVPMTGRGYQLLVEELKRLKTVERPKNIREIEEARGHGDLSENAEYDAAKEAQAHCEARIAELEGKLVNVRIIEDTQISSDKVFIGAVVSLVDLDTGEELQYMLVSPEEADYEQNKLSIYSPIGKALIGHQQGEEVSAKVPAGILRYKIVKIERPS